MSLWQASAAWAGPFIWDQDGDKIDDRVETVHALGYEFSFQGADSLSRQTIEVTRVVGSLVYGVYIVFDHVPTNTDVAAVTALGMPVLHRYEAVPAFRSVATFAQALAMSADPGVERVEAIPLIYPQLREGAAAIAARDPSEQVFPTWDGSGGAAGEGVTIAFLDTGINDQAEGAYPGHESLAGRVVGGASFVTSDSTLDTPRDGTTNPSDHGGAFTRAHGTHVAGIALGDGGPSGYARGVAPGARAVDVKVLGDAGVGTGVCEALDWCIHNRTRDWGVPGYEGIDIINLSLSGLGQSDGNDLAARLAQRAVELGIVVVASVGNEGQAGYTPSPAAGDGVIAVGAVDDQRSPLPNDDVFAAFSDRGPRASDGDLESADEQKPDLIAPGVSILSADGDLATDGHQYQRMSGTSMAAGFVSGAVACLRSAYPALTPAAITDLLRATAWRDVDGLPSGPAGSDPRWQAARGFGVVDLYAARLEMNQPGRSQVVRLELSATPEAITATWRTQRELGASYFALERAPDTGGSPGTFADFDSAAATGSASLAGAVNRAAYGRQWNVPELERGVPYWYRVAFTEGGVRTMSAPRRFVSPIGPSVATIEVTLVHNAYDNDIDAQVTATGPGSPLVFPLPGTTAAVASDWVDGNSTTGNVAWTFRVEVPAGGAVAYLPPSGPYPWRLSVAENGFLNRSGRITAFRVIWHSPSGNYTYEGGPVPQQTVEGITSYVSTQTATGVEGTISKLGVRVGPNPVIAGAPVRFHGSAGMADEIRVFDLAGRQVARVPIGAEGAVWDTRDAQGHPVGPGLYLARMGAAETWRIVVLPR